MYKQNQKRRENLEKDRDKPMMHSVTKVMKYVDDGPVGASAKGSYIRSDDDVDQKAEDRQGRLDRYKKKDENAKGIFGGVKDALLGPDVSGPFVNQPDAPKSGPPETPEEMAQHHEKMAKHYLDKYLKPGTDTVPHTTEEKDELEPDVDMGQ